VYSRVALTTTDIRETGRIFSLNSWPLPQRYFRYVAAEDKFELWRIQPDDTKTLVATDEGQGWVLE
jgi:hypothetical protein